MHTQMSLRKLVLVGRVRECHFVDQLHRVMRPDFVYAEGVNAPLRLILLAAVAISTQAQNVSALPRFEDFPATEVLKGHLPHLF